MPYPAPSLEAARRAAAYLSARRIGSPACAGSGRTVTGYVVERYAMPGGTYRHGDFRHEWGVVERWRYNDRPDLPEMGGAFVDLQAHMFD